MSSPRRRRRRDSIEEPPNMRSDVINLQEELNRLHKDISPEFKKHLEKISDITNELKNGFRLAIFVLRAAVMAGGIGVVFAALSFILNDEDVSDMFAGTVAAAAVVAALCAAFGIYKKTQQEKKLKNLKRTIEVECKGFQDKINLIIDKLEKICQRTEEILRDLSQSEHKAQVLSEHFSSCVGKARLFQDHDSKVGDRMSKVGLLSRNFSEMIAKVNSVPDILKEIIEDNKRLKDKSAKLTHQQIYMMEFKEKTETFINDLQKGICRLKNSVKEIN
ncbi:hypothetical protein R3I93_001237 [Phoxinus phoxinus]|uniref:Uncharacterized protein n=1 Tax=Phoxinus phoxinus TaxID=58324 RepID=A0AAN9DPL8_9TELE